MASHRLIQHVGKVYGLKVSEALYDRLNVYYFVDGHALNDRSRLAKVAHEEIAKCLSSSKSNQDISGNDESAEVEIMSAKDILDFLNGNQGRHEIEQTLEALSSMGVHGIPKFIIEGRRIVDGAAHSDIFVQIFRDIEQKGEIFGPPVFGELLGVSEEIVQRGSHFRDDVTANQEARA